MRAGRAGGPPVRALPVPFILITAFADEDTRAEARALGAAAFLEKPLSIADLQAAIRTAIEPH